MKPTSDTQPIPIEPDELNEIEKQASESGDEESLAPESPPGTEGITVWDESTDANGRRVPSMPLETEDSILEQLVNAGNEEADSEQRDAADELEEDSL